MDFNLRKAAILSYIYGDGVNRSVTPSDLVFAQDIEIGNACVRLSRMYGQGYLTRSGRGKYRLSTKGDRIRLRLKSRIEIKQITGYEVSLNLRKPVPFEVLQKYKAITGIYPNT